MTDRPDILTARLERAAADIPPETWRDGRDWYPTALREARAIADLAPHGIGPGRAAAIIAALSPRAQWSVNLRWAERVARHAADGGRRAPHVSTLTLRAHAWAIATGADPDRVLNGPKVRAFWRNILGDPAAVTLDTWAIRPLGWGPRELRRRGSYELAADCYRAAAASYGETPRDFQAALWLHLRGRKPTDTYSVRPASYDRS